MSDPESKTTYTREIYSGAYIANLAASNYVRHYIKNSKPNEPITMVSRSNSKWNFKDLLTYLGNGTLWQFTKLEADADKAKLLAESASRLGDRNRALHTTTTEWLSGTEEQVDIVYLEYDRPWGAESQRDIGLIASKDICKLLIISFPMEHEKADFSRAASQSGEHCITYLAWGIEEVKQDEHPSECCYSLAGLPNAISDIIEFEGRTAKMIGGSIHGRLLSPETSHTQTVMTMAFEFVAGEVRAY